MQDAPVQIDPLLLVEHTREAMSVHELDGTVRFWNRGAERLFGIPRSQALGRPVADLLGPGSWMGTDPMRQFLADGACNAELECRTASGHALQVDRQCTLLPPVAGQAALVLATHADVTEQRRAEKEIVLLSNVMEQRIRKRTAQLEESNKDLREFAYSLAHDLRAPMASIDGFSAQLELRLSGSLDDRSGHYLRRVRAGVKLMSDLTDGLLALADIANAELQHQHVDLSALARNAMERLRESQPSRDVALVVDETMPARGDVRLLVDVLQNLVGNAWKFTSRTRGARIEFGGAIQPDAHYAWYVRDNGAGFDPEYAYKLFGPFQRLHRMDEFEGTGIGLAIVRKIVSRHGGRIWAESRPGEGATFYFTLG